MRVRPEVGATLKSIDEMFDLWINLQKSDNDREYLLGANALLMTAWPYLRDGHVADARQTDAKYNKMVEEGYPKKNGKPAA
jgi:hypothetical protein